MARTFKRLQKQVDDRVKHSRPRGDVRKLVHEILVYCCEVHTFHVKHLSILHAEGALSESEKELLAAGEQLLEGTKLWLAGE